jgi:hypothetical protein
LKTNQKKREIFKENNYSRKKFQETKKKTFTIGQKKKERSEDVRLEIFCAFIFTKKVENLISSKKSQK